MSEEQFEEYKAYLRQLVKDMFLSGNEEAYFYSKKVLISIDVAEIFFQD